MIQYGAVAGPSRLAFFVLTTLGLLAALNGYSAGKSKAEEREQRVRRGLVDQLSAALHDVEARVRVFKWTEAFVIVLYTIAFLATMVRAD